MGCVGRVNDSNPYPYTSTRFPYGGGRFWQWNEVKISNIVEGEVMTKKLWINKEADKDKKNAFSNHINYMFQYPSGINEVFLILVLIPL